MADVSIGVDGESLRSLQKALKQADAAVATQLRMSLKSAADLVATTAKGKVPSRTGRAAGSIRAGSTLKGAYVAGGRGGVPYYGWLDFGTRNPRRGNPRSVGPWSGSGKGPEKGRFIYPAIDDRRDEVTEVVQTAIDKSIKEAGF